MPATIKDVARESGVSAATVSYVLNDGPRTVHPATRERVLAAIQRLQFHPSTVARGLARKRLDCLGVVLPHPEASLVVDPYFSGVLDGVIRVATQRKQNVTLYTGLEWRGAAESLPAFRDRRVDGLLLVATLTDIDIVATLTEAQIPFVLISATSPDLRVASVDIDNITATRTAVRHLLDLGHRRIAFLSGQPNSPSTPARRQGYAEALASGGIAPAPALVFEGAYSEWWGQRLMEQALALPEPPTAVLAGNDAMALGAYRACQEAGVSIPDQMSIVGFDDTVLAVHMSPQLTTVRQPLAQLGEMATRMLLDRLKENSPAAQPARKVIVPTELIVRASTAPPRPDALRSRPWSGVLHFSEPARESSPAHF